LVRRRRGRRAADPFFFIPLKTIEETSMHWVDPDFLPDTKGRVKRFIVNPHGEIDGLILTYDDKRVVLVHVPPHLDREIDAAVRPGDEISVRGIRPRGADMLAAVALTTADGGTIIDEGPGPDGKKREPHHHVKPGQMTLTGTVRLSLFGPKGELRGALLDDGNMVRIDAKEAPHFAEWLRPRSTLTARGQGLETKHGKIVAAKELGPHPDDLRPAPKRVKDGKKKSGAAMHAGSDA
jgi:hypothetical protein